MESYGKAEEKGLPMATVSKIDNKLEELKRQAAALKEQRRAAAAKEREQARKWKAMTLAAIGESVLKAVNANWTDIDIEALQGWLSENADGIRQSSVTGHRAPAEAKEALDAYKKSLKAKRDDGSQQQVEPEAMDSADNRGDGEPEGW